jgi:hypothetical protein
MTANCGYSIGQKRGSGTPALDSRFIQSMALESEFTPATLLAWYEERHPLGAASVGAAVSAVAGFFTDRAYQIRIVRSAVRTFQRQQPVETLMWATQRMALEPPTWRQSVATAMSVDDDASS